MAITRQTPGTLFNFLYAGGTENGVAYSAPVPAPTTVTAGDILILRVSYKPQLFGSAPIWRDTISTPAGFTLFSSAYGGGYGNVQAAGTGNVGHRLFYKVATGTEGGTTVTVDVSGLNVGYAQILRYSNATGSWGITASVGEETAAPATTAWTHTLTNAIETTVGDHVLIGLTCTSLVNTPDFSAETISQTGATFAAVVEDNETVNSSGNKVSGFTCRTTCTAGSGSVAPTIGATLFNTSGFNRGVTFVVVIREVSGGITSTVTISDTTSGTFAGSLVRINRGVKVRLRGNLSGALEASLTALVWCLRSDIDAAIIANGTTGTTDANGDFVLASETIGALGTTVWLTIRTADSAKFGTYKLQVEGV